MIARVKVYAADGSTARTANVGAGAGILPTQNLTFSVEIGGGGGASFTALTDDMDSLSAWDSVIHVELETAPSTWTAVAAYALRGPYRFPRTGKQPVECTAVGLLEAWATETVLMPEYATTTMPRGAGTDRALGWMSTAYDPGSDPNEAWDGCYETSRSGVPTDWPTGTGALWISITGASDWSERKLFRAEVTLTAAALVKGYFSSDESATVYVGGEPVLDWTSAEDQGEHFDTWTMVMQPGTYAVAVDTQSVWSTGGDGVDPILLAMCTIDDNGDPDTWLLASNETDFVACRRDDQPPDNEPPGPTPGTMIDYLVDEAVGRSASGWDGVTLGFTATTDSQGDAWSGVVVERMCRYGSDTYWAIFQMLGETGECDIWMDPDLTLQAANSQGADLTGSVELDDTNIAYMSSQKQPDQGSYAMALALDGWIDGAAGSPRREYGLEIGTAISRAVADRIVTAALDENGRWDGSVRLAPSAPVPLVDFAPGDRIGLNYYGSDTPNYCQVLSCSASAGEASLLWDVEIAEVGM